MPSFEKSYREIGSKLNISGVNNPKADVKTLVKERLSTQESGKWLMIVDNADELNLFYNSINNSTSPLLSKYLPFNTQGAILFTTRDHRAATKYAAKQVISIKEMDDNESRELFSRGLQNKQLLKDSTSVIKLLELLVNLPLAIVQAAAYLNENTTTIAQYLQIYEESGDGFIQLLSEDFEDEGRYPEIKNPIITTWLISFNQIRGRDPLAADYLAFISCIKEENIPLVLLPEAPLFDKTKALGTLKGFKFVNEQPGGVLISMHKLVHLAMRNWLRVEGEWTLWNEKTLDRMEAVFPWPEHENRTFWTALLSHAQYIITSTRDFNAQNRQKWNLFGKLGRCFWMTGNDKNSEEMYQQELELIEKVLGREHPDTLRSMNNLALALSNQGKYAEAELINHQTLALQEKVLGKEHPDTLISMNNLAVLLNNQGKYNEAELINHQTLALNEKVLGKEHPDTLRSMNNLAVLLKNQGNYNEAEPIYRQTLALREKVLGKEHPGTLRSMNNLAALLDNQGKFNEAEPIYRQTLALKEKVLGKEHPDTLRSMNNLAGLLDSQGKYNEAELIYYQTLALNEKMLGKEHPDTLRSMENLALLLKSQGKEVEAEKLCTS